MRTLAPVDKIEGPGRSAPRPQETELCENHAPVDKIKGPGSPAPRPQKPEFCETLAPVNKIDSRAAPGLPQGTPKRETYIDILQKTLKSEEQ